MEHHWKRSRMQGPATACATAIASTIETATAMRTATQNKKRDDVSCESNDGSDANDDGDEKPWRQSVRHPSIRRKTHDVSRVERRAENDVSEKRRQTAMLQKNMSWSKQRCFTKWTSYNGNATPCPANGTWAKRGGGATWQHGRRAQEHQDRRPGTRDSTITAQPPRPKHGADLLPAQ